MKSSWDEIIASDKQYIDLIWYGSILNTSSHEWQTSTSKTVLVSGFKRIYNLKMVPWDMDPDILENFRKKYWVKYWLESYEDVIKLQKSNNCVLNIIPWDCDDILNGVLIMIHREDFVTYKQREEIYELFETQFEFIHPVTWDKNSSDHSAYILSALPEYTIDWWHAFLPYHNFSRDGAYEFGDYFGKLFDETTHQVGV